MDVDSPRRGDADLEAHEEGRLGIPRSASIARGLRDTKMAKQARPPPG